MMTIVKNDENWMKLMMLCGDNPTAHQFRKAADELWGIYQHADSGLYLFLAIDYSNWMKDYKETPR